MIKLTKSIRRQIYTQDVIMTMIISREMDKKTPLTEPTRQVINDLKNQMESVNNALYGGERVDFVDRLSKKHQKLYIAEMTRLGNVIESAIDGQLVGLDYHNATLMVVDDTLKSIKQSKKPALKVLWDRVLRSTITLYNHITKTFPQQTVPGHEWTGYKYMQLGEALGYKLERVMTNGA